MCHNSVVFTLLTGATGTKQGVGPQNTQALEPVPPARDRKTPKGKQWTEKRYRRLHSLDTCALGPVLNYVPRLKADAHVPRNDLEKTLNAAARPTWRAMVQVVDVEASTNNRPKYAEVRGNAGTDAAAVSEQRNEKTTREEKERE